jgi:hypothetical protein
MACCATSSTLASARTNRQSRCGAAVRVRRKSLMRERSGPLQNRVTPFGDILVIEQRGLFIGNRGIIHDPATKTLLGGAGRLRRGWFASSTIRAGAAM